MNVKPYVSIFFSVISLFIGGMIYIVGREKSLMMFDWFNALHLSSLIEYLRASLNSLVTHMPSWLIYSLPSCLWSCSWIFLLRGIWNTKGGVESFLWCVSLPIAAIVGEIGQLTPFVPGHFDVIDLIFLLFPFLILLIPIERKTIHEVSYCN